MPKDKIWFKWHKIDLINHIQSGLDAWKRFEKVMTIYLQKSSKEFFYYHPVYHPVYIDILLSTDGMNGQQVFLGDLMKVNNTT